MLHLRALLLTTATAAVACSLDPIGTASSEGGAIPGTTDGPGPTGPTSSGAGTPTTSAAGTSSGDPASTGTGGAGQGGAGQGGGGQGGAAAQGGASATGGGGVGQGGAGQGGAGQGGAGQGGGGAGQGGDGVTSSTAVSSGSTGAGGAEPVCGDGNVDPGEECDGEVGCDLCAWVDGCDHGRHVAFAPGGARLEGNTAAAPTTDFGGQCSASAIQTAPDHLYEYTSGPVAAYVQVIAFADATFVSGLGDPLLSLHPSCVDESLLTCIVGNTTAGCCVDSPDGAANEILTTTLLPPGSTITAAVTGYGIDQGTYDIEFRDVRLALVEPFAVDDGSFTSSGWQYVTSDRCASGGCMAIPGEGDHPNEVLTSSPISTSGSGRVFLYWNQWVDNAGGNPSDRQGIEISTNAGQTWTSVREQANGVDDLTDVQRNVELPAAAANVPDLRVRFVYADAGGADLGWYVDDVVVVMW